MKANSQLEYSSKWTFFPTGRLIDFLVMVQYVKTHYLHCGFRSEKRLINGTGLGRTLDIYITFSNLLCVIAIINVKNQLFVNFSTK